jgi:small conductance mechanosensitive channel
MLGLPASSGCQSIMVDQVRQFLSLNPSPGKVGMIAAFLLSAWIIHLLAGRLAGRIVKFGLFAPKSRRLRAERQATLQGLVASAISLVAFVAAVLLSLGLFAQLDTLIWMVGLFSAAFGLGARPLISDVLTGISLIFDDTFAVGEKVEILGVEGVVESVNLRITMIRAPSGELFTMPNGEIRVVRNFSRGSFSTAKATIRIHASSLSHAIALLEEMGKEAVTLLPNLLEPWQVLSENGLVGQHAELTLLAKARFGKAAEMRPRMLTLVQEHLTTAGIDLAD